MNLALKRISLPLAPFSLQVDVEIHGRVTAIFGPSGAGKTSLLDLIAGLRRARSAFIQLDGEELTNTSRNICVPARHRGIGYVPQDLALFPHLSVRQNLLYGHKSNDDTDRLFSVEHITEVLEIQPLIPRSVLDLSGGEKQRVALARALLTSPRLLLLDEPLASLDGGLKAKILPHLARVRDEFKLPMLYVTHNPKEVSALCDEVLVMSQGRIISQNPATESTWKEKVEI
jgi:molybdate transport system ATP-binding protein